jgi:hypothetical protein
MTTWKRFCIVPPSMLTPLHDHLEAFLHGPPFHADVPKWSLGNTTAWSRLHCKVPPDHLIAPLHDPTPPVAPLHDRLVAPLHDASHAEMEKQPSLISYLQMRFIFAVLIFAWWQTQFSYHLQQSNYKGLKNRLLSFIQLVWDRAWLRITYICTV